MVAPVCFEVAQEAGDPVEGEVFEPQSGDLAALVSGREGQQQPDGVPVAAHRGGAQALDRDQVIGEIRVQERPHGIGRGHGPAFVHAGAAKSSKRRLAWSFSSSVMVR
jgi:hypothetical protein